MPKMSSEIMILVFGTVLGLIEIIKLLVRKAFGVSALSTEERNWLEGLHELHCEKDPNGVPLVYVPRACNENQRDLVETLHRITITQKEMTMLLRQMREEIRDMKQLTK